MAETIDVELPGLNCGLCGYPTCDEFQERLASSPEMLSRCIHLSTNRLGGATAQARKDSAGPRLQAPLHVHSSRGAAAPAPAVGQLPVYATAATCGGCAAGQMSSACAPQAFIPDDPTSDSQQPIWRDHLGREFDFFLEHFPEEPGPREIILPHNPLLTRELNIQQGDILIGRPLGMSCGCPITHCGIVTEVDHRTGVIVWCVTGPLGPRQKGFKDLGYYIAEAYEGLVRESRSELKLGLRYFFQPRMCMLQWRHSGLINYISRSADGYQIRIEGLWIG